MKKIIFLVIITISLLSSKVFSQDNHELNWVALSPEENAIFLDSLESAWMKIKDLPLGDEKGNYWEYGDIVGTVGKIIGKERYIITVDKKAHWDDGSVVSMMTFYINANNKKTRFYPQETITFYYNHKSKKGIGIWITVNYHDDPDIHEKDPEQIRKRINELVSQINQFI